jgi:hypothetical protein
MKNMPKMNQFEKVLTEKIRAKVRQRFSDKEIKKKAIRIGNLLVLQTKMNIKRAGLIDTGRLLNSIDYKARSVKNRLRIEFGSYAVKYAAVHEFGYHGMVTIPAHTRSRGGKKHKVRTHKRNVNINPATSSGMDGYIRPSIVQRREQILKILLEA